MVENDDYDDTTPNNVDNGKLKGPLIQGNVLALFTFKQCPRVADWKAQCTGAL